MSYIVRYFLMAVGIQLTALLILIALGYGSYICPLSIFSILGLVLNYAFGKRSYTIEKENLLIPEKFQSYHQELLALGFELDCVSITSFSFSSKKQWFYRHKEEGVEAYIHSERSHLWFSSYFEQGLDVSTYFQTGEILESEKLVTHIVKTSIPAAFDFHLQTCQKYLSQYGSILRFENIEQLSEWENRHETQKTLRKAINRQFLGFYKRLALALFMVFVVGVLTITPVEAFLKSYVPENAKAIGETWLFSFLIIGAAIGLAWAWWPMLYPKSVEERKKKEGLSAKS